MKKVFVLLAATAFLAACNDSSSSDRAETTPTPTPGVTASPSPSSSPDPSASPTATPEPTPLPDFGDKGACLVPVSPESTVSQEAGPGCISCTVGTPENVISGSLDDNALMSVNLSLLPAAGQSDLYLQVDLPETIGPDQFGDDISKPEAPGFVVSFPESNPLALGVLPELVIETFKDGAVVDSANAGFGFGDSVALATIVQSVNDAQVFLGLEPSDDYDAIRLSLTGAVLNTLITVNVHQACVSGVSGSIEGEF